MLGDSPLAVRILTVNWYEKMVSYTASLGEVIC